MPDALTARTLLPTDLAVVDGVVARREHQTAEDVRAATARLLALVGDHVDAAWYVQFVEADAAGRIVLFAEAAERLPDSSMLEASDLVEQQGRDAADAVQTGGQRPW